MLGRNTHRWALTGALIGAAIVALDMFTEWRGAQYLPWDGSESIIGNIVRAGTVVLFAAAIGFIAGAVSDRRASARGEMRRD
jgi:hypothetical protein